MLKAGIFGFALGMILAGTWGIFVPGRSPHRLTQVQVLPPDPSMCSTSADGQTMCFTLGKPRP